MKKLVLAFMMGAVAMAAGSQCPSELQSADRLPSAGREAL